MGAGGEIGMVAMCTWNKLAKCCRHGGTLWLNLRSDWHLQIPNTQNKTNTKGERERERELAWVFYPRLKIACHGR